MNKTTILLVSFLLICIQTKAQEHRNNSSNDLGFGFHLTQNQKDFGFGIHMTSPYFAKDQIALRFRGNLMFYEHIKNFEITWTPYVNFSAGVVGVSGMIGESIRLYGEGGLVGLVPSDVFSSTRFEIGGYGVFGFEFNYDKKSKYFIEMGGIGTGAKADKIIAKPIYSNGFLITVGMRFR